MSTAERPIEKVAFVSLGCPKNLVDSEKMLGTLVREPASRLVSDHDAADAVVINTCGFLEASKDESLEVIHEAIARKEAGRDPARRRGRVSRAAAPGPAPSSGRPGSTR